MPDQNSPSVFYTAEQLDQVSAHLDAILKILGPNRPVLSNHDMQVMGKYGDANDLFTQKCIQGNEQFPGFMPRFVDVEDWKKNYQQAKRLRYIKLQSAQVSSAIRDVYFFSGWKALTRAQTFYKSVQMAAKKGVKDSQTLYQNLQFRFKGMGKRKKQPITPLQDEAED